MPVLDFKNMDKLFILLYKQRVKGNEFENKIIILENFNPSLKLPSPNAIADVFMEYLNESKIDGQDVEVITVIPLKFATYVGFADKNDLTAQRNIMQICSEFKNKKEVLN